MEDSGVVDDGTLDRSFSTPAVFVGIIIYSMRDQVAVTLPACFLVHCGHCKRQLLVAWP
jgi:hypothetical protein